MTFKAFNYINNSLHIEKINLNTLAKQYGTPLFVYSRQEIEQQWSAFNNAFKQQPHLICFAVKANSNIAILNLMAKMGSGFDIVSEGELERALTAQADASKIVFSGVAKTSSAIKRALEVGIYCFNVESAPELTRIQTVAKQINKIANISIRVNPDVDAKTHPYISTGLKDNKFGVDINLAPQLYAKALNFSHINITGIDCHIGSQITQTAPFTDAIAKLLILKETLTKLGINIKHINVGGGLGIKYLNETPPSIVDYVESIVNKINDPSLKIIIEPGRAIVGHAGVLLTEVEYLKPTKHKNFAIIDAAMNDLIRPSLYEAYQQIQAVTPRTDGHLANWDLVGPVCETGDFLGKDRKLNLKDGDILAIMSSGAYGFSMSSNYNTRPRAAEILVDNDKAYEIRPRETYNNLFALEKIAPIKKLLSN